MPRFPVSKGKIVPPSRRPQLLTRRRLLDLLFNALDKELALVSAPAGYGKTSLLIDLVSQSEFPCCWLSLDEMDREPQRFAAYFIAALAERFPEFGSQSNTVLENMSSFEEDMESLIVSICNEISDKIPEYFIFVLDDFHLLEDVQPVQNFVERFVQLMGENCHLAISSRRLTDFKNLSLLVARNQVGGLDFSELAFLPQELQALFAQNNKLHISDEQAKQLIEETEGWITGLQYSNAENLPKSSSSYLLNDNTALFNYFEKQVLGPQPPELQEFILRTALFDEFDASLCESILGQFYSDKQDWKNWIKSIANNNLFALPVGSDGAWLRYHHLFRDFIRDRLQRDRPGEIPSIFSRLETVYETMDEWEKAHYICEKLKDQNLLEGMIVRSAPTMFRRAIPTLESWLNELPPSRLRERAELMSIRGAILVTKGELPEGLTLLTKAEHSQRKETDLAGLNLTLTRRAHAYRILGDYASGLRDADEVIDSVKTNDELQFLLAIALRTKGLILHRMGSLQESLPILEESLQLFELFHKESVPDLLVETGMVYRATGNYVDAQNYYERARKIWQHEGNLFALGGLLNNMGGMYHARGEYEKAVEAFEEGLLCAQRSRSKRLDVLISIGLGDLFAELEDFVIAEQTYKNATGLFQGMEDRLLSMSLSFANINLALLKNDSLTAEELLKDAARVVRKGESESEEGILNWLKGRLYMLQGKYREAVKALQHAENYFLREGHEHETNTTRIWIAAALHQNKDQARSIQIIEEMYGNRRRFLHAAIVAAHQAQKWLVGLQKHTNSASASSLRDLFTQANRFAKRITELPRQLHRQFHVLDAPPSHLFIQGFGQAVVTIGGQPLTISDWQTQSVREFFFYLLSLAKAATKDQIGETLWQDKYGTSKLNLRFKNEIYRLRKAVGYETVKYENHCYSFNRTLDYEYDVEAFESHLAKAKSSEKDREKIEYYKKAVDLVSGPFLNDIFADWAAHDRDRLSQLYMDALASLGNLHSSQGDLDQALEICQRAIGYDPYYEIAYQIAMKVYHKRGDKTSIRRIYEACVEAQQNRFQQPPSLETKELYQRLME